MSTSPEANLSSCSLISFNIHHLEKIIVSVPTKLESTEINLGTASSSEASRGESEQTGIQEIENPQIRRTHTQIYINIKESKRVKFRRQGRAEGEGHVKGGAGTRKEKACQREPGSNTRAAPFSEQGENKLLIHKYDNDSGRKGKGKERRGGTCATL